MTETDTAVLSDDDRTFLLDVIDERTSLDRELGELDLILQQTTSELESAAQRQQKAQATLKEYLPRIESLSRDDVRKLMTTVCQAELRHAVVREQRDRLAEKMEISRKLLLVIDYALRLAPAAGLDVPDSLTELQAAHAERNRRREADQQAADAVSAGAAQPATTGAMGTASATGDALARIIQAQEEERQRLARQMHDGPAQSMTNLILRAELCERLVKSQPERAAAELVELKSMVNNTLQETRQFIFDVRPMILDDLGLVAAVKRYVEEYNQKRGTTVSLTVKGVDRRLPNPLEIALFRIVQDALKIQENRGPDRATQVLLGMGTSDVMLTVQYPQPVAMSQGDGHRQAMYDFETIQQRVATIGGTFELDADVPHPLLRVVVGAPPSGS